MFIDKVKLVLQAGKGGNGAIAWRREKYIPKGGPAGGDGGNGGSIYLKTSNHFISLEDYRNKRIMKAENGVCGGGANKKGRNGKDLVLSVPVGTIVKNVKTGEILFDLTEKDQKVLLCKGGIGGIGNTHFKSSTNQAPNQATDGTKGEDLEVELELKILADIGLVGFPNAGKSTLMNKITNVYVKIAPYPFTTLKPNLGIKEFSDYSRILIADIPGIIKDAHKNKGLGFTFLKHIERTSTLIYVIDISGIDGRDPLEDFFVLEKELKAYSDEMTKKQFIIVLNKIDTARSSENLIKFKKGFPHNPNLLFEISALEDKGITPLLKKMKELAQINGKKFY